VAVAFVFPGQGSQKVGMGQALAAAVPAATAAFTEADAALGFALSRLCFEGPEEELALTANTQPAILTASLAAFWALSVRGVQPNWVAGHSLGEWSALVAAGALELSDAVKAVRKRGRYMQEAVPVGEGAMAAILMLDLPAVQVACGEAAEGQVVVAANINSPGQIVIAGHAAAVERAMERCKARGAKRAVRLPVSAPFHSPLMWPAQERLAADLPQLPFRAPSVPLVNNVDARPARTVEECRDGLLRQVSGPVRWEECVQELVRQGARTFVEVGPGQVLSGLIKKIDKSVRVLNVEDPASLDATVAALKEPH
jgi:[acyl-carrier-protein] S-malonyltransferase